MGRMIGRILREPDSAGDGLGMAARVYTRGRLVRYYTAVEQCAVDGQHSPKLFEEGVIVMVEDVFLADAKRSATLCVGGGLATHTRQGRVWRTRRVRVCLQASLRLQTRRRDTLKSSLCVHRERESNVLGNLASRPTLAPWQHA